MDTGHVPRWVTCRRCGGCGVIGADLWDGTGVRCDGCAGTGSTADDGQTEDLLRALTITGRLMRSTDTGHTARQSADGWRVTWLHGRALTLAQAITAMMLAAATASSDLHSEHPLWPHVEAWDLELGLTGPDAIARASEPPGGQDPNPAP